MPETRVVKLSESGGSQVVRLPAEFRFDVSEVYVTRDEQSGDVVLSMRPGAPTWAEFFAFMRTMDVPEGFIAHRPMNVLTRERELFEDDE